MMKAKYPKILIFSPNFAPFANPEAIVNNKLALSFINAGWHIDIISRKILTRYEYNYGSEWVAPWHPLKNHTHEVDYEIGGQIRMKYEALRDGLYMGYILEGCRWAYHAYKLALELHKKNKYDVVLSRAIPDAGHMPALKFSRIAQIPWIANWNDPTMDKNPPPTGKGIDAKLGVNLNKLLNDVKNNADWLTFPSERMRQYVCTYLGDGACQKSSIIPHAAIQYNCDKPLDDKTFKLCHAGNLYASRKPENFLQALRDFSSRINVRHRIKVTIIGIENVDLKEKAKRYNVENMIHFTGPLSYADTMAQLSENDVLIVLEGQYEEGIYLPSKFIDYVQTGRPVLSISPKISTLNDIISQYGGGIAADCRSAEAISNALCELYEHWEKGTLNDKYGSHKLYNLFAPATIIGQYVNIFNQIALTSHQTTKF